ncbi:Fibulin-1 [Aphelenchoides besseyi]|nr:Fibulin-1 [Aphelenchoides besseyi]
MKILLFLLFVSVEANELSRCCAGGSRHYREAKTCQGLKSEGNSGTCRRAAEICCLRASLEKSCELGTEMAQTQSYCSSTVNILGGGLRKECCDCCQLGKELRENGEECEAPVGFSAYCLKSFNECCNKNFQQNVVSNSVDSDSTDRCKTAGCEHFCTDRGESGIECSCRAGYDLGANGRSCVDIDECLLLVDDCLESQRCLNTPGSYKCIRTLSCGTGYALDSETEQCVDVDECNLGAHDCGLLYHCRNTQGSYRCDPKQCAANEVMDENGECTSVACPAGYLARDGRCEGWLSRNKGVDVFLDVDECQTPHKCGNYEECINTPGSYRCQQKGNLCAPGYQMDKESGFCLDIDECQSNLHTCGQLQCINLPGTFKCRCGAGYEFNETTKICEDVNECVKFRGHICSHHATCENTIGSFVCHCMNGYRLGSDGRHCDDIDECSTGEAKCQQRCINTPGSYQCVCERGYQLGANELTCEDIDECATWARSGNQLCMGDCENTPGSFKCTCPTGYLLLEDNVTCKDIDECSEIGCPYATDLCVNTLGSFRCQQIDCPKNYVIDRHYKNRCVRKSNLCANPQSERCKRHPVHISWQHIAIPKHVNISTLRTSITLFSMKGPVSPNSTMQFELRLVNSTAEAESVTLAVRENFLIQKGDDRNSAVIALRDSLDGPQTVHLELILRLTTDDGYSCLKSCKVWDHLCLANYTKEILYQYRAIPTVTKLDRPLEITRVTVFMEVSFRSEFIMDPMNRDHFAVQKEGTNTAVVSLIRPIHGPRSEIVRIVVNNRSPRAEILSHNLIYIKVDVGSFDF